MLALFLSLVLPIAASAHPFDHLAEELAWNGSLVDVSQRTSLTLDFRYATENNFTRQNVYGPFRRCFLHAEAAEKLDAALSYLQRMRPLWKLKAFDCLRPVRAQRRLFAVVQGTPQEKYVVNPRYGSLHSYGFALDVTLVDEKGREADMGTGFDYFGPKAEPQRESELLVSGELTPQQVENRQFLRNVMRAGGFRSITTEWWHFDALDGSTVRANYDPVE